MPSGMYCCILGSSSGKCVQLEWRYLSVCLWPAGCRCSCVWSSRYPHLVPRCFLRGIPIEGRLHRSLWCRGRVYALPADRIQTWWFLPWQALPHGGFGLCSMHSTVGRITPNTRRIGSRRGKSFICMLRRAFAEAVLHARMTRWHPISNSLVTACKVNS